LKKEQIITEILKFDYNQCPKIYERLKLITKWNEKAMLKEPNLNLHDLWRELKKINKNK